MNPINIDFTPSPNALSTHPNPLISSRLDLKIKAILEKIENEIKPLKENDSMIAVPLDWLPVHQFIYLYCNNSLLTKSEELNAILKQSLALNTSSTPSVQEEALKASSSASSIFQAMPTRLQGLQQALDCCRQKKQYKAEYFLRLLFTELVCLDPNYCVEEIWQAIQFEKEHLESVIFLSDLAESPQERYDSHLNTYLDLLLKIMGSTWQDSSCTLQQKFAQTLNDVGKSIGEDHPLNVQIAKNAVFLYSRPEWLFFRDRLKAGSCLIIFQSSLWAFQHKYALALDLILMKADQAIDNQYIGQDATFVFSGLLEEMNQLIPSLSLSDKIIALSMSVKLNEALALYQTDPASHKDEIVKSLKEIINIGDTNFKELDFKALHLLAQCRFSYGFYLSLGCQTKEEFETGRQALSMAAQDFWADGKTRQAAARLQKCLSSFQSLPPCVKIDREKFLIMQQFKLMLQNNVEALRLLTELINEEIKTEGQFENEELIWAKCQSEFSSFFFNNQLGEAKKNIHDYYAYHRLAAEKFLESINTIQSTTAFYKLENSTNSRNVLHVRLDTDKLFGVVSQMKDYPLVENGFILAEEKRLNSLQVIRFGIQNQGLVDASIMKGHSSIETFYGVHREIVDFLKMHQGNLSYTEFTKLMMHGYIRTILSNKLIEQIFDPSIRGTRDKKGKLIDTLRHEEYSLLRACQLVNTAYNFLDCFLPDSQSGSYMDLFNLAQRGCINGLQISDNDDKKLYWTEQYKKLASQHYLNTIIGEFSSQEKSKAHLLHLYACFCYFILTKNSNALENMLFSDLPDTWESILERFEEILDNQASCQHLCDLVRTKSFYMMSNQRLEESIDLYSKVQEFFSLKSNKKTKAKPEPIDINKIEITVIDDSKMIDPTRIKRVQKTLSIQSVLFAKSHLAQSSRQIESKPGSTGDAAKLSENQSTSHDTEGSSSSTTKAVKQEALQKLKDLEAKKEKKQARVASLQDNHPPIDTLGRTSVSSTTSALIPSPKIGVNSQAMSIFNRLFDTASPADVPWDLKSYRNDIDIARKDALYLIRALKGSYDPKRGHGSHHVAHLPKITLNGKDVGGLVDYEDGELMITLTNNKKLKFYQIIQLRKILLMQGFNPDTVEKKD